MRSFGIAERVGTVQARLGEGPRWDAATERLLWVDIEGGVLHAGERSLECGAKVCAAATWTDETVLVALADALVELDLRDGSQRHLVDVPVSEGMRCNDGDCDPQGRFWIGTMSTDLTPGAGALHRYDVDGTLHTVLDEVTLSNGLCWDRAGRRMYYVDSPTQRVDVLDFDGSTGALANRRPFATIPAEDGLPDGLAIDDEDGIWVALHGGGEVRRFAADGSVSGRVEVPVAKVTACCFAGNRLFVTSAGGGLFALDGPFSGPPARRFGAATP